MPGGVAGRIESAGILPLVNSANHHYTSVRGPRGVGARFIPFVLRHSRAGNRDGYAGRDGYQRVAVAVTLLVILCSGRAKGIFAPSSRGNSLPRKLAAALPATGNYHRWSVDHAWEFVVAGFTRRIEWRGTQYELVSPDKVRVSAKRGGWRASCLTSAARRPGGVPSDISGRG